MHRAYQAARPAGSGDRDRRLTTPETSIYHPQA